MKNSVSSSPTKAPSNTSSSGASPTRKRFALTGRSVTLDPRTHAVRPDIADVRLAEQVFAPHYASALRRTLSRAQSLRETKASDAATVTELAQGAAFDVLEIAGGNAWGIAPDAGLVGYIDASALA